MAIKAYSYAKDGSKALSKNFHVWEFQCKDHSDPIFILSLIHISEPTRPY